MDTAKIPVILQTDIGGDIDDFWALIMLLKMPELDLKLVFTDTDNTVYRAAICAKLLTLAGREDIEIAPGIVQWPENPLRTHLDWVKNYNLATYPNYSYDGISRLIEQIMTAPEPVTLVAIGPAPSLAEALRRCPAIAPKTNFVGMFGSLAFNHDGKVGAVAEYNVVTALAAAQQVFRAPWRSATLTPLDSCGQVRLRGELFRRIDNSNDLLMRELGQVFRIWRHAFNIPNADNPEQSSILYDTVAVHLATSHRFLKMEKHLLGVDDRGFTVDDCQNGMPFNVAVGWNDLDGYCRQLTEILLRPLPERN